MSITDRRFGDYTTGPLLGRGGTSEVYAGTHVTTGAPVAIKLLRSHLASDPAAVAAFAAEAVRTNKVDHPNVVRILDAGGDAEGFYLVMERLDGPTLATCLAEGALDEPTARILGAAIADGIAAAHANGIVHRDLKPGNVVVVGTSHPVLVDFGIARELDGPGTTTSRVGTPAYMAPEQLVGGVIAPCVDIWALGALLYEMVTGKVPFETDGGRAPQLVDTAPRLADVSPGYAQLVAACLAKEPSKRPASAAEVARELRAPSSDRITEDVATSTTVVAPIPGLAARTDTAAPAHSRSRRVVWIAAISAGVVATLALAIGLATRSPADELEPAPQAVTTQPERVVDEPTRALVPEDERTGAPDPAPSPPAADTPPTRSVKSKRPSRAMTKLQKPAATNRTAPAATTPPRRAGEGLD